jgi:hypothetical protein
MNTGEIKRHPEAETLLLTGDNRTEVMRKVLTCLMYDSSPLTGEDLGEGDTPPTALCTPLSAAEHYPIKIRANLSVRLHKC